MRPILLLTSVLCLGCHLRPPDTIADPKNAPAFGYTPLDPLDAFPPRDPGKCPVSKNRILASLPDVTMRIAVATVEDSVHLRYGTGTLGTSGNRYVVVLDYMLSQTRPLGFTEQGDTIRTYTDSAQVFQFKAAHLDAAQSDSQLKFVPIYLGVGLRLTANVTVLSGTVDLGNLIAIGAAAQANQVSGTMVVQTLGISGAGVSAVLPMPSDINTTTIQTAIQALGQIKTKVYDDSTTRAFIQVLGFYNPFGGGQATTNRLISTVLLHPPHFYLFPCPPAN